MAKKLTMSATACVAMLLVSAAFAFATVLPANAQEPDQSALSLQAVESQILKVAASSSSVDCRPSEGDNIFQGTGVTWTYDMSYLMHYSSGDQDSHIDITSVEGDGEIRWEADPNTAGLYSITAVRPGSVVVTLTDTWMDYTDEWNEETLEYVEVASPQSELHTFSITAVGLNNVSGPLTGYITGTADSKLFTVKLSDLPANSYSDIDFVSDSNKKGDAWVRSVSAGKIQLYVYGAGTHKIKLKIYGKVVTCKVALRVLGVKKTADLKNTGSLVMYPGKKSTLHATLTGVKNPKLKWQSTNKSVARVNKKGVVTAKGKGRCYLKAKIGGATVKVLAEVTSKGAYQAVRNGFADMNTKLTYSQPSRMSRNCRDCSSFVSRCYWDTSLGRRIFLIGGSGAAQWAYNAAAQAKWLNDQGKRVSWKACSEKKLRPGDTVYFETDYAGKDASQWHYIDHAGMYVGNGYVLNTGGYGGKGTVGLMRYWPTDSSIKLIGRPLP